MTDPHTDLRRRVATWLEPEYGYGCKLWYVCGRDAEDGIEIWAPRPIDGNSAAAVRGLMNAKGFDCVVKAYATPCNSAVGFRQWKAPRRYFEEEDSDENLATYLAADLAREAEETA